MERHLETRLYNYIRIKAYCLDCFSLSLYDLMHQYINTVVHYICMLYFIYKQHLSCNSFNMDNISLYME